jgi:hypothetical protein
LDLNLEGEKGERRMGLKEEDFGLVLVFVGENES